MPTLHSQLDTLFIIMRILVFDLHGQGDAANGVILGWLCQLLLLLFLLLNVIINDHKLVCSEASIRLGRLLSLQRNIAQWIVDAFVFLEDSLKLKLLFGN
jgi:hypothetical protein